MPYKDPEDQKRAARAHYETHKDLYKKRAAEHRKKVAPQMKALIRSAKDRPCTDCGIRYPYYVMQFDHIGEKSFTIGTMNGGKVSMTRMKEEIDKCEVVCANCHAERTHGSGRGGI